MNCGLSSAIRGLAVNWRQTLVPRHGFFRVLRVAFFRQFNPCSRDPPIESALLCSLMPPQSIDLTLLGLRCQRTRVKIHFSDDKSMEVDAGLFSNIGGLAGIRT